MHLPPRLIFQSYVVTAMYIPIQFLQRELVKLRQSQSLSDDLTSDPTQKKQNGSNFVLLPLQRLFSFFFFFSTTGNLWPFSLIWKPKTRKFVFFIV